MADRYWVGGTGNWNDTARWSTGSGGLSGASVPTSADNVFFDNSSAAGTFTVTINVANAACANFDASGITNAARKMTLTGTASVGLLQVNGNWTNPTSTYFAWTTWTANAVTFAATGTVITNSVTFGPVFTVDGSGITLTLGSALTTTGNITLTNGTLETSSANSYSLTTATLSISANSNTRALNLNASSVSLSGSYSDVSTGGYTLSAGTSTITLSATSPTITGNGKTFYNVTFSSTTISTATINGSNTYNNVTFADKSAAGLSTIVIETASTQTINGTLTVNSGNTTNYDRQYYVSGVFSSTTISAAAVSLATVGFKSITASGAASPFTGTNLSDLTNNSNITFAAAKTVYWSLAAGGNWNSVAWATSSNGTPAAANYPLGHDTVIIDDAGLTTGNTITMNTGTPIGALNCTRSNAWTLALSTTVQHIYGDFTVTSSTTTTGGYPFLFNNLTNYQIITSNGAVIAFRVYVNGKGVRLNGDLTTSTSLDLNYGEIDLTNNGAGNYNLSVNAFNGTGTNARSIKLGTGSFSLTSNITTLVWNVPDATNLTFTGTPTVTLPLRAYSRTISHGNTAGGTEGNSVNFKIAGSITYTITINGSVRDLEFTAFAGTLANTALTVYGNYKLVSGMTLSAGANATTFAATSGTQTITTAGKTLDFPIIQNNPGATLQLQDNTTLGSTRDYALSAGTLDLSGKTLTTSTFTNTGTSTRAITFNGGTISLSGSGSTVWNASGSGFTTSAGTGNGTISLTSASAKTFVGGGYTYAAALNQGGAGALTVSGSNTFSGLKNSSQPATITITASTTQTFTGPVTLAGTSGNLITLNSSAAGTRYTFTYPVSTTASSLSFCSVRDCIGYENAYWQAYRSNGCTNAGNNLGWVFNPLAYNSGGAQFTT